MERRVAASSSSSPPLAVLKRKTTKRIDKKKSCKGLLRKAIAYLRSDSHLFSPFISSQSFHSYHPKSSSSSMFPSGLERKEISCKDDRRLSFRNVSKYLKTDCYMYASIVSPLPSFCSPPRVSSPLPEPVSCHEKEGQETSNDKATDVPSQPVELTVNVSIEDRQTYSDSSFGPRTTVRKTLVHRETLKHMVNQNCRSSSVPEGSTLRRGRRKIAVD